MCPLNPRKRINPADIEEMAESILEHGIIQPPIARPREKRLMDEFDGPGVEIVFGQRRCLGAKRALELARERGLPEARLAELEVIPVIVRPMDDRQVIEEAWVENLQRVDVSVREEAEGFSELLKLVDDSGQPVYTQASLAQKLGKSVAFLSQRLKLKHVPELLWEALEERRVGIRHLELVGTIADGKAREKAAKAILEPKYRTEPLTTREAANLIEEEYRKSLKGVAWDPKDESLVPVVRDDDGNRVEGGACTDCPHRTGNVPELQGELATGAGQSKGGKRGFDPNVCLRPGCHRAKEAANWKRLEAAAAAGGRRVLTKEEAKKVFMEWGGPLALSHASGLVALQGRPDYSATGHHGSDDLPTWEELIEGTAADKEVLVAKHPKSGEVLRLIDRERAIHFAEVAMKERGEVSPFSNRPKPTKSKQSAGGGGDKGGPKPMSEWEVNRQARETSERAMLLKIREVVTKMDGLSTVQLCELVMGPLLESIFECGGGEAVMSFLERVGYPMPQDDEKSTGDYLKECRFAIGEDTDTSGVGAKKGKTHADAWLVILVMMAGYESFESESGTAFLKLLDIDAEAIRKEARAQIVKADEERVAREQAELDRKAAEAKAKKAAEEAGKAAPGAKKKAAVSKKAAPAKKKPAPAKKKAKGK